uniref:PHB domain-containing protein n=1 Tax=Pristionchus pacificus TaxID=54126 RepID=A0A8R1UIM4_PRIPA
MSAPPPHKISTISQLSTADRRQRLMRRTHTLQSDYTNATSMDVDSLRSESRRSSSEKTLTPPIDPNRLQVPTIFDCHIVDFERPPHERDVIEKIPMRARSQSWLIRTRHMLRDEREPSPFISHVMFLCSVILMIIFFPWSLFFCIKVCKEYERAVMFRLGRLHRTRLPMGTKGPGLFLVMPCLDTYKTVDLRVLSFDVPPQEILSRDSVTVSVEAVIFFRINNPIISVTNVNDAQFSTRLLAQTTLRNVLGTKTLSEMLSERDAIASITEKVLDEGTDPWGVKVERVEIKDIRLPNILLKSMAAEAEAARDARARVIAADGEMLASKNLKEAADVLCSNRHSVNLRYLQTLSRISVTKNHTLVLPFPAEIGKKLVGIFGDKGKSLYWSK